MSNTADEPHPEQGTINPTQRSTNDIDWSQFYDMFMAIEQCLPDFDHMLMAMNDYAFQRTSRQREVNDLVEFCGVLKKGFSDWYTSTINNEMKRVPNFMDLTNQVFDHNILMKVDKKLFSSTSPDIDTSKITDTSDNADASENIDRSTNDDAIKSTLTSANTDSHESINPSVNTDDSESTNRNTNDDAIKSTLTSFNTDGSENMNTSANTDDSESTNRNTNDDAIKSTLTSSDTDGGENMNTSANTDDSESTNTSSNANASKSTSTCPNSDAFKSTYTSSNDEDAIKSIDTSLNTDAIKSTVTSTNTDVRESINASTNTDACESTDKNTDDDAIKSTVTNSNTDGSENMNTSANTEYNNESTNTSRYANASKSGRTCIFERHRTSLSTYSAVFEISKKLQEKSRSELETLPQPIEPQPIEPQPIETNDDAGQSFKIIMPSMSTENTNRRKRLPIDRNTHLGNDNERHWWRQTNDKIVLNVDISDLVVAPVPNIKVVVTIIGFKVQIKHLNKWIVILSNKFEKAISKSKWVVNKHMHVKLTINKRENEFWSKCLVTETREVDSSNFLNHVCSSECNARRVGRLRANATKRESMSSLTNFLKEEYSMQNQSEEVNHS